MIGKNQPENRLEEIKNMAKGNNDRILSWEEKTNEAALKAVGGELEASVSWAGAELTGFSMRLSEEEVLMTLRGIMAGRAQIAFVASGTMAQCFVKACREARRDNLRWKPDKFAKNGS